MLCAPVSLKAESQVKPGQVKIGAVLTLTGFGEKWGQSAKQGIDLALEQINATGGIKGAALEVAYEDFKQFDLETAAKAAKQLIAVDNVKVLLTQLNQDTEIVAKVAAKPAVVTLAMAAGAKDLTEKSPWLFRLWPSDETLVRSTVEYAIDKAKAKKAVILVETSPYFQSLRQMGQSYWDQKTNLRATVLQFPSNTTDFGPYLEKMRDLEADVVFMYTSYKTEGVILKQAQSLGLHARMIGVLNSDDRVLLDTAAGSADGLIFPRYKPPLNEFSRVFQARYGTTPGPISDIAYDAIMVLAKVMREYGTEPSQIQVGLYNVKNFAGVSGPITFDQNRNRLGREIELMTIQNGFAVHVMDEVSTAVPQSASAKNNSRPVKLTLQKSVPLKQKLEKTPSKATAKNLTPFKGRVPTQAKGIKKPIKRAAKSKQLATTKGKPNNKIAAKSKYSTTSKKMLSKKPLADLTPKPKLKKKTPLSPPSVPAEA